MKLRVAPLMVIAITLTACAGGGNGECREQYWDGTIGMCLTDGWTVLDQETRDRRGAPGEVIAAFQKQTSVAGQFPTIVVTRETIPDGTGSAAFSKASIRSVTQLPGYKQIDTRPLTIDDVEVELHVFSAKPQPQEPERRFEQVSVAKGTAGYTVTAIAPLTVGGSLQSDLRTMLGSVTLREPGVGE